ncbi:hypothetical protein TNIN_262601 [Trichonephila inaurata madagascariensis]|uniref:Uncharacterized protein n=1 Tax=Trichonephila inaurata madagascariensis TaxID=2747483 RepID=A0A8X6WUI2_9ARAC|nr:hypothetical protein TNIN_262601 [Trichonephila inaurata madagascariensis]
MKDLGVGGGAEVFVEPEAIAIGLFCFIFHLHPNGLSAGTDCTAGIIDTAKLSPPRKLFVFYLVNTCLGEKGEWGITLQGVDRDGL